MRKTIRYEKVLPNGHRFFAWKDLKDKEKEDNFQKTTTLIDFLTENPNTMVTYTQMNNIGLNHLYKFQIDEWNDNNPHRQITVTEQGAVFEKKNN
jgi:hypothetical protein